MNIFGISKISGIESPGEILRNARLARRKKIEQISEAIGIKKEYLDHIENDAYSLLPQGVYVRTFIKEYASYLGLNAKPLISQVEKTLKLSEENPESDVFSRSKIAKSRMVVFPRIFKIISLVFFVLVAAIYFIYYLGTYRLSPELEILSPATDITVESGAFIVKGKADSEAQVFINQEQVLPNENGEFQHELTLRKGVNIIRVTASRKNGREAIVEKRILFK